MQLIDRYLQAVGFWLPKEQANDITAELAADIYARVEEEESKLGRTLTEDEVGALLKQRGRPVLVANGYLPSRYLIGPLLFPIYAFVMKVVALCYLIPMVLVWAAMVSPWGSPGSAPSVTAALGSIWTAGFVALSVVTLVFAAIERVQASSPFLEQWDPAKLPPLRKPNPDAIPRLGTAFELAAGLLGATWLVAWLWPYILHLGPIQITMAPVWRYFYWGFLAVSILNAALAVFHLFRPYWAVGNAMARLLLDLAGSALFCWLLRADVIAGLSGPTISESNVSTVLQAIHLWSGRSFSIAVIIGVVIAVINARRVIRLLHPAGAPPVRPATLTVAT